MEKLSFVLIFTIVIFLWIKPVNAATLTVCPDASCRYSGGDGIQQAVNAASNGDTILIKAGTYTSEAKNQCFVDLGSKTLTLQGEGKPTGAWDGTVLYGEGHDAAHANVAPYDTRAGICSNGGNVTIKNMNIREFQGCWCDGH